MPKVTFNTVEDGWKQFMKAFANVIPPQDYMMFKRAFYAGGLTVDCIVHRLPLSHREMTSAEVDAAAETILAVHNELQTFARDEIAMVMPNPNN